MGFNAYGRVKEGLSEFIASESTKTLDHYIVDPNIETINRWSFFSRIKLMPIGSSRRLDQSSSKLSSSNVSALINCINTTDIYRSSPFNFAIFDCRGGIDEDSLAVCASVDHILIVVETDAAAIRASQFLVDVLSQHNLTGKVLGFVLNKVMDNPIALADASRRFFNAEYLGAVPFDIETTRDFIRGNVPKPNSIFSRHVFRVASKIFIETEELSGTSVFSNYEYSTVTLKDPDLANGNIVFSVLMILLIIAYLIVENTSDIYFNEKFLGILPRKMSIFVAFSVVSILSTSDSVKKIMGRVVRIYANIFRQLLRIEKRY